MLPIMILAKYYSSTRSAEHFGTPQLERATRFPNVPSRDCDWLSNVPIRARMIASSKSVYTAVFFYNNYYFLSQYAFHVYLLIVLIKA